MTSPLREKLLLWKRGVAPALAAGSISRVKAAVLGFSLVFTIGIILFFGQFRLAKSLEQTSYEWSFDRFSKRPNIETNNVVIVYLDEASEQDLKQPKNVPWDRALHARLLQRLTADAAKAVIFDIIFSDPGPNPAADEALEKAIRDNGRVMLGVDLTSSSQSVSPQAAARKVDIVFPLPRFEKATQGLGHVMLNPDEDFLVRQHSHASPDTELTSLSWTAAAFVGSPVALDRSSLNEERWMNYYGPPETVPHISFSAALDAELWTGFFKDKIVFIGARPKTGVLREKRDEMRNPVATSADAFIFMPAVEVHATMFLNLIREDWLRRPAPVTELLLVLFFSAGAVSGLLLLRPFWAVAAGVAIAIAILLVRTLLFERYLVWFPWVTLILILLPVSVLWSIICNSREWYIQRRKMEADRRVAEARIREQASLLDKARDAIVVLDLQWQSVFWSQGAVRIYGWSEAEIVQLDLKQTLFSPSHDQIQTARSGTLATGEWTGEMLHNTRDGRVINVESRWSLVREENGAPKALLLINTDITERKKLEVQFLRAQRMESIGTLAGGIAHDLNNVLSPIIMGVELLRMKSNDPFSNKMLSTIDISARRGADLVKQVLTFARGEEGERKILQLRHLIKDMEQILKETFPKSIHIKSDVSSKLWPLMGDATQLHQVLLNFCVNARDAMPLGGELFIGADNAALTAEAVSRFPGALPGKYIVLTVTDTGTGIPPEIMEKIFEPFFTTKEVGKGTGLGLSTVISIVKSHGAFLDIKSEVGKGTSFMVYFPAIDETAVPGKTGMNMDLLRGRGEVVLVVDDEATIRLVMEETLRQAGYKVFSAPNGFEAYSLVLKSGETFDVAIIDMMMPIMDGPTLIRNLVGTHPDIKIVAMSGLMENVELENSIPVKGIKHLMKPITAEKLLESLAEVLG